MRTRTRSELPGCWTYSHHCQIADKNPSKRWNGEFRGVRIWVGWISTTRFCVVGFMCPINISLFCVSLVSSSLFSGYHAPSIPHGLSRLHHHCTATTLVSFPATTPRATTPHLYRTGYHAFTTTARLPRFVSFPATTP